MLSVNVCLSTFADLGRWKPLKLGLPEHCFSQEIDITYTKARILVDCLTICDRRETRNLKALKKYCSAEWISEQY